MDAAIDFELSNAHRERVSLAIEHARERDRELLKGKQL